MNEKFNTIIHLFVKIINFILNYHHFAISEPTMLLTNKLIVVHITFTIYVTNNNTVKHRVVESCDIFKHKKHDL